MTTDQPGIPQRALLLSGFVNRVGNGLFNTASVLYFTLVVRLPAAQVGVGLTVAGLVGLLAGIPAGDLADRHGPRAIVLLALILQAATMTAFVFIHSWGTLWGSESHRCTSGRVSVLVDDPAAYARPNSGSGPGPYPQVRLLALAECGTRALIGAVFDSPAVGERSPAHRLAAKLAEIGRDLARTAVRHRPGRHSDRTAKRASGGCPTRKPDQPATRNVTHTITLELFPGPARPPI